MLQEKLCSSLDGFLSDAQISYKRVLQAQQDIKNGKRVDDLYAADLVFALMVQEPEVTAKILSFMSPKQVFTVVEETADDEQHIAIT